MRAATKRDRSGGDAERKTGLGPHSSMREREKGAQRNVGLLRADHGAGRRESGTTERKT
jgi:hypothetical protein